MRALMKNFTNLPVQLLPGPQLNFRALHLAHFLNPQMPDV